MESETWSRYIVLGNVVVDYNIQIIRPSIHLPSPLMRLPFPFAPFKWTHREYSNGKLCFFVEHHLFLRQPSALNCFWWDYDGFCLLNVRTLCDVSTLLLRMLLRLSCRNEMERYEYIVFKRKMKKKWTKWKKKNQQNVYENDSIRSSVRLRFTNKLRAWHESYHLYVVLIQKSSLDPL